MQSEPTTALYRQLYAYLIRFYPRPYRERFAEGMDQTFNDLCMERVRAGKGLLGFVLWMFSDTFIGIISVRISFIFSFLVMHSKHILRPAIITMAVLLIPTIGMLVSEEWDWDETDFIVIGTLVFAAALGYELIARKMTNVNHRIFLGLIILATVLLIWVDLAVGIFNIPGFSGS
jgi:hypothetical protein